LQIREGQPVAVMGAFAADYNVHVEPLRDGDSACWTNTNDVGSSNHLSGTGMDLNWNGPDNRTFRLGISKERAYPPPKWQALEELIDFYEGMIFCGGNWNIRDWMHFQMGGNTYGSQNVERVNDFIRRKIRADGFSTYKRGAASGPPPPPVVRPPENVTAIDVLAKAAGVSGARARELLDQVSFALIKANCTNPNRIAAALAQWVVESGHFQYTEEIADGPEDQERWRYKGRTWVQLTWLENYRGFSQWCHGMGLVPTPDYFVVRPTELAQQKWAALGPAYWWVKYPQINEYADRGDIDNVSKWVNAPAWVDNPNKHANGEAARRAVYNQALALGDSLMTLVAIDPTAPTGDDMSAEDVARLIRIESKIDAQINEWGPAKKAPSRSFMATDGAAKESPLGFLYWTDGNVHAQTMTWAYLFDVDLAVQVVETVAANGVYDGSWADSEEFNAWLREFGQQYCEGLVHFKTALMSKLALSNQVGGGGASVVNVAGPSAAEIASAVVALMPAAPRSPDLAAVQSTLDENAKLRADNDRLRREAAAHAEVLASGPPIVPVASSKTTGQNAGEVITAVSDWTQRLLTMQPPDLAALEVALKALKPPGGQ
jgi:putative chitinase